MPLVSLDQALDLEFQAGEGHASGSWDKLIFTNKIKGCDYKVSHRMSHPIEWLHLSAPSSQPFCPAKYTTGQSRPPRLHKLVIVVDNPHFEEAILLQRIANHATETDTYNPIEHRYGLPATPERSKKHALRVCIYVRWDRVRSADTRGRTRTLRGRDPPGLEALPKAAVHKSLEGDVLRAYSDAQRTRWPQDESAYVIIAEAGNRNVEEGDAREGRLGCRERTVSHPGMRRRSAWVREAAARRRDLRGCRGGRN
ncbi:hypothetical protein EDB92DRAFT_1818016 [Lactarius akahatsu]|uniref:Uncharacterized protein n=1 Tax=Lactarius akahatsu TaxID=416441 RepID=A0AAD4LD69_9AGAM|nr:hypothetical protein EDB92DRAFT_1818016 [Lactarius akahatsu]